MIYLMKDVLSIFTDLFIVLKVWEIRLVCMCAKQTINDIGCNLFLILIFVYQSFMRDEKYQYVPEKLGWEILLICG